MSEVWKAISGHEGYEVSDQGRVRCWRPIPWNAKPPAAPRILKPRRGTNGYLSVILGFKGPTRSVHTLVAEAFVRGRAPGFQAAHSNGDKDDNRATNLSWKTPKENHADKIRHGTHGRSLTPEKVNAIRAEYQPGVMTQEDLAIKYGTTQSTVSKIVLRQRWGSVA